MLNFVEKKYIYEKSISYIVHSYPSREDLQAGRYPNSSLFWDLIEKKVELEKRFNNSVNIVEVLLIYWRVDSVKYSLFSILNI